MSFFGKKGYEIAKPGTIETGTICDSIEQLTDCNHIPTITDYINFVVRYIVSYIHQDKTLKVTEEVANRVLNIVIDPQLRDENMQKFIQEFDYQLRMMFDIGASVKVVKDIIERKLSIENSYTGIDMGTGSGITLVAQYIQARRNGVSHQNIHNVGIEILKEIATYTNDLVQDLQIGNTIDFDSTKINLNTLFTQIDFVTNENIPYYGAPYFSLAGIFEEFSEPFLSNIYLLQKSGIDISDLQMFPRFVKNGKLQEGKDGLGISRKFIKNSDFISSLSDLGIDKYVDITQRFIAPKEIFIDNEWVDIRKVGTEYYENGWLAKIFPKEDAVLKQNPLVGGRWSPTRIKGIKPIFNLKNT